MRSEAEREFEEEKTKLEAEKAQVEADKAEVEEMRRKYAAAERLGEDMYSQRIRYITKRIFIELS